MKVDRSSLVALITKFVSGDDTSIAAANAIEVSIDEAFPDDEEMQDVVVKLASYNPVGGDFLYDEEQIEKVLMKVLERLGGY